MDYIPRSMFASIEPEQGKDSGVVILIMYANQLCARILWLKLITLTLLFGYECKLQAN